MTVYVDTPKALADLAARLHDTPVLALDTEFIGEHSYYPRLALIQLADATNIWLVDPLALTDLSPLGEALSNPDMTVVLHDGESDLGIMNRACNAAIPTLFDSQIAAAFAGMPEHVGLQVLVKHVTGRPLVKGQQVTNWLARPLSKKQLTYAANDVRYLVKIYHWLMERLTRSGRLPYVREEIERARARWTRPVDLEERFSKLFDSSRMTRRRYDATLALLAWREKTAVERDIPRRHVLPDDAVCALSETLPSSVEELRTQRMVSDRAMKRYGEELIALCRELAQLPDTRLPSKETGRTRNAPCVKSRIPIVKMALEVLAEDVDIAPGLIARADDIRELCRRAALGAAVPTQLPCMSGWRYDLVGEKLWRVARGEASIRVGTDPEGPAVILETVKG